MTPEEWEKVSRIFHSALEVPHHGRPAFLDKMCADDTTLRNEIESLLSANKDMDGFIDSPPSRPEISEMPSLTGAFFGHYRVEGSLGRGGMGEVYLATDTRLHRRVALKKLPDRYTKDPVFVRRFENEARAAATLNHKNLATIYTVEEFDGRPFITMEYVEGKTLDSHTPQDGLDVNTFRKWFTQIADGLGHAHERGVTHRDIKPGNIMISVDGSPKILDFGLARVNTVGLAAADDKTSTITDPGQIIGTPSYMSPEQAKGAETDHRSDIFSLGVVMYEAISGCRPFTGDSKAEIISGLLQNEPKDLSSVRDDIPEPLARLVMKCLAKKRSDRPRNMREVANILSNTGAQQETGFYGSSFAERLLPRTSPPHPVWAFTAVIGVAAAVASFWYFFSSPVDPPLTLASMTMRRLTQSNNIGGVVIAPDGRSIVYVSSEENAKRALWVRRVDDPTPLQLVPPEPVQFWSRPIISEDGDQAYYLTANSAETHGTIYRISTLGGSPRKLIENVSHLGDISTAGEKVLFVRYGPPTRILSASSSDGSGETVVHEASDDRTVYKEPRLSADGTQIYFIKHTRIDGIERWSLVSIPASGGSETEFFNQKEALGEIHPLQDRNIILMTAVDPATNLHQIFYLSLTDGKRTRLTNDLNSYRNLSIDNAGNIASIQVSEAARVYVGPADDLRNAKPLTKEPNAYGFVDWTPDGRVIYDAYENNKAHIWISDLSGKSTQLTDGVSEDIWPRVSGDGRFIVFSSDRGGPHRVWRMNIDGSNPTILTDLPGQTERPMFAADGRTVYFYWHDGGRWKLAGVPVEGGPIETIRELPVGYSFFWAMSPDGKYTASTHREPGGNRSKVAILPVGSQTPQFILDIWPTGFLRWTPDGKGLIYKERQSKDGVDNKIFAIDLDRRVPKVLFDADPDNIPDLVYSRDRKKAAMVRVQNTSDAVLLAGYAQK